MITRTKFSLYFQPTVLAPTQLINIMDPCIE